MFQKLKCFLGLHSPSSTASYNSWLETQTHKCIYCSKTYKRSGEPKVSVNWFESSYQSMPAYKNAIIPILKNTKYQFIQRL